MAKHEIVHLVDDLDGSVADGTVTFGLDDRQYEIDLSGDHAAALREHLSSYIAAARRPTGASSAGGRPSTPSTDERAHSRAEARAMRSWARSKGFELSDRGRIPASIVRAYRGAHTGAAADRDQAAHPSPPDGGVGGSSATPPEPSDAEVLAWHKSKNYKIPADRSVNGLMRHRYRTALAAGT